MPRKLQGRRAHTFPIWWKSSLGQRLVKEKWNVLNQNQNSETRGFFASLSKILLISFLFCEDGKQGHFPRCSGVRQWSAPRLVFVRVALLQVLRGGHCPVYLDLKPTPGLNRMLGDVCLHRGDPWMSSQSPFKTILPAAIASRWNCSRKIFWFQYRLQ